MSITCHPGFIRRNSNKLRRQVMQCYLPSSGGGGATLLLSCLDWLELWRPVFGCVASARQLGLSEGWLRLHRHFHFFPWKDRLHPDKFSHIFIFPLQLPRSVIRLMFNQSGVKCVGWANAWCALSSWHETIFMSWGEKRRDGGQRSENIHFKIYR